MVISSLLFQINTTTRFVISYLNTKYSHKMRSQLIFCKNLTKAMTDVSVDSLDKQGLWVSSSCPFLQTARLKFEIRGYKCTNDIG